MNPRRAFGIALILGLLLLAGTPSLHAQQPDAPRIYLRSASFDPLAAVPSVPAALHAQPPSDHPGLALIQFVGPVQETWRTDVQQAGVQLYAYIPDYTFVARLDDTAYARVQHLPFVRWIGAYHPAYKLDAALANATAQPDARSIVTIQAVPDVNLDALAQQIRQWNGTVLAQEQNAFAAYLRVELSASYLVEVARADGVMWIAPYAAPEVLNSVGGGTIIGTNAVRRSLDLYGRGQIVAVADTGLDTGNPTTLAPDVRGRVRVAACLGRPQPCDWSDPNGHGTHVAGTVLGNGATSNSDPSTHSYLGSQAGIAPEAGLVMQSLLNEYGQLGGVPMDQGDLVRQAYRDGARIHNNSWGSQGSYGAYALSSQQVDAAAWEHKDMLVVFAAGNGGADTNADGVVDPDSLYEQGVAKNALTVGASESLRPGQSTTWNMAWGDRFRAAPITNDTMADDANGMAAFSSRGPTDDGRVKPDIVAPGTYIVSLRSRHPQASMGWGQYDNNYVYNSGTSMAAPMVSGAAALTREWLARTHAVANPSAALVKALLLNGAASMGAGQYGEAKREIPTVRPNSVAGWGRVDLERTLDPAAPNATWFADNTLGLATGERSVYTISIGEERDGGNKTNGEPATHDVALADTTPDPQGATPDAARTLQNGGFERGMWTPWETYGTPRLVDTHRHTGAWGAALGGRNKAQDQLIQRVTVPDDARSVTFSFSYRLQTDETVATADRACYGLWPLSGNTAYAVRCLPLGTLGDRGWGQEQYTLTPAELAAAKGQAARVGIVFVSNEALISELWVDDVVLDIAPVSTLQPVANHTARMLLAWTDYPGQPMAARALVNDLDLEVIAPDGTTYWGNQTVYAAGHRCLRGAQQWDACNNVEGVNLPIAAPGTYTVIVRGANVPQGTRQSFALVATGNDARIVFRHAIYTPVAAK